MTQKTIRYIHHWIDEVIRCTMIILSSMTISYILSILIGFPQIAQFIVSNLYTLM